MMIGALIKAWSSGAATLGITRLKESSSARISVCNVPDPLHTGPEKTFEVINYLFLFFKCGNTSSYVLSTVNKFQSCKISSHDRQALQNCRRNPPRLDTVHFDLIGPLNISTWFRYVLTTRNRGSSWRPLEVKELGHGYLCVGTPLRVQVWRSNRHYLWQRPAVQLSHVIGLL